MARGGRNRAPEQGGRGRKGGAAAGPGGYCVCPSCGRRVPHAAGQPCTSLKCPDCQTRLVRES